MSNVTLQHPYPGSIQPGDQTTGSEGTSGPDDVSQTRVNPARQAELVAEAGGIVPPGQPAAIQGVAPLPELGGPAATSQSRESAAQTTSAWLHLKPFHLDTAISNLLDQSRENALIKGDLRRTATSNEYTAQNASAGAQLAEVEGERQSAVNQFIGASVGAAASATAAGVGTAGSLGSGILGIGQRSGAALTASGQAISSLVSQSTNLIDKFGGGNYDADEAKIAKANLDTLVTVYKAQDDEFTQGEQSAQQDLQNILQVFKDAKANIADTNRNILSKLS